MTEPKRPKFDWGAIADSTGGDGRGAPRTRSRGGGARVTVLVSTALGFAPEDNPNVDILSSALEAKHVLRSRGYPVRARAYSDADLAKPEVLDRLRGLGVDSLPAAVATEANGHRRVAVGLRDSKAMLREIAQRPAAEPSGGDVEEGESSVEDFYDRELRSERAWKAATDGNDESGEIGGTGRDLGAEYHQAMRSRGAPTSAPNASREGDVVAKAAERGGGREGGDGSGGEGGDAAGETAMGASDGAEIMGAVAAVNDGDLDSGLMAKFWEGHTETSV